MWRAALVVVALGLLTSACAQGPEATHVFVRDPHQVWVEVPGPKGEAVLLPPGAPASGVRIAQETSRGPLYAFLVREPSGSITVDDRACAPWPTSPLHATGELKVEAAHAGKPFVSDGQTVRVPYVCRWPGVGKVELEFVTPWSNVREVRVVEGETEPIAEGSSEPALQPHAWGPMP